MCCGSVTCQPLWVILHIYQRKGEKNKTGWQERREFEDNDKNTKCQRSYRRTNSYLPSTTCKISRSLYHHLKSCFFFFLFPVFNDRFYLSFFRTIHVFSVSDFHCHWICFRTKRSATYIQVLWHLQIHLAKVIFIWCFKALSLKFWIYFWIDTEKNGMKNAWFKHRMGMQTNRTNCHMIYQYSIIASRPDKQIMTVRKKKKKKKKMVPIITLIGSHKWAVHNRSHGAEQIKPSTRSEFIL